MGASVTYLEKQALTEELYDSSVDVGDSFLNTIKTARKAARAQIAGGTIVVQHSANGHEFNKEILSQFTPVDAIRLVQEIRNRYTEARNKLVSDGNESPTDEQIKDEILDKIHFVGAPIPDFSGGRLDYEREEVET